MKKLRATARFAGWFLSAGLLALNYTPAFSAIRELPDSVHIQAGERYELPVSLPAPFTVDSPEQALMVAAGQAETLEEATGIPQAEESEAAIAVRLFGVPVKRVALAVRESVQLVPGGNSIGVTLYTRGALVVGVSMVDTAKGALSPAAAAGIQAGDIIEAADDARIESAAHLAELCNACDGSIRLTISRGEEVFETELSPVLDQADGRYRMGMWVRDSTAGVGTLSFYDPETNWYCALGHGVMDADTRSNLTVREGEIVQSSIVDIVHGEQGEPGELRGTFGATSLPLGTIEDNGDYGIYGEMYQQYRNPLYPEGLPMAYPEEVEEGEAALLTTLDDGGIRAYACSIIKSSQQSAPAPKGMVVEITDPDLLSATGGIVQGMSGSPIVQNGKLIGVVTHVFVNDPTRGYCMHAQWMHEQIKALAG